MLDVLTAAPVAHRGLHGAPTGRLENTLAAVEAAIERGFAVEVDLQLARCGEAMVFHDFTLDRLTDARGPLVRHAAMELRAVSLRGGAGHLPTLPDLLAATAGRAVLFLEIKSHFDGAPRLVERVAHLLADYRGPAAVMSFDPAVLVNARGRMPDRPIGIVSEVYGEHPEWARLTPARKKAFSEIAHADETRPDFIAYNVRHLPSPACEELRRRRGLPLLTWTVRTPEQRAVAAAHADQMIFEGFLP
jgi:glycerophosphoryl diester phosphodiesterase